MKVLMKGYSDLVGSYEHYLKNQEEEELRQEEETHRKHLEECVVEIRSAERRALEKGKAEGLALALLITLKTRFKNIPEAVRQRVFSMTDQKKLERLAVAAATCAGMDEFAAILEI